MKLRELLAELPVEEVAGDLDVEVVGISADSREVRPGWLFVAYQGKELDLHRFVPDAVARGAVGVVMERVVEPAVGVARVVVLDGRTAEGLLAAAFFGHPSRRLGVIGVTGTDGKTTTSTLIHAVLEAAGRRAGLISTVGARIGAESIDTGLHTTTPRAIDVQRLLRRMVDAGAEWAILETTSHALAQRRTVGVEYDVAVLTNVTHEHLDEHGTFEAYRAAKLRLFEALAHAHRKPRLPKTAIVNADDPSAGHFLAVEADRRLTYALDQPADVGAMKVMLGDAGSSFVATTPAGRLPLRLNLPGRYNIANALAAVATAVALGLPAEAIAAGVARVGAIPGRMERIERGQPFTLIVDFAHTPNSLEQALQHGRRLADAAGGRLIAVFGCAGERDAEKRPLMGEVAGRLADLTLITDEDRRREDVQAIMAAIAAGARRAGAVEIALGDAGAELVVTAGGGAAGAAAADAPSAAAGGRHRFLREPDRGAAIERAVRLAQPGDVVMLCGKGHERSMCFGTEERPWSDQAAAAAALERLMNQGHPAPRGG